MTWADDMARSRRVLLRRPGFLVLASATLSLGTAVMVGALTLLDAVLWQPPPWPNHARVVVYGGRTAEDAMRAASPRLYELVGTLPSVRSRGIARMPESVNVIYGLHRELLRAQRVDPGFLPTLGVVPLLGHRLPVRASDAEVMVSSALWRRWLESDEAAIDRTLLIDGQPMRVAGVLPADYRFFSDVDLILPTAIAPNTADTAENLTAVALLARRDGVAAFSDSVSAAVRTNASALRLRPQDLRWYGASPLDSLVARGGLTTLWLCVGCALLVLAVAGMNVSNLMLTRTLGRAHEMALKLALGANGWRLWLPALADAMAVGLLAAAIGLPMGSLLVVGYRPFLPDGWLASALPLKPGWDVLATVTLITLLVAMLSAAGASVNVRVEPLLRDRWTTGGRSSAGRVARRAHAVMILAQTALATLLLTLGVAAATRWWRLEQVPLGFDRSLAMVMELRPDARQYPGLDDVSRLLGRVRARALQLPGVDSVGWSTQLPVGDGFVMPFLLPDGTTTQLQYTLVTAGALEAMGLGKIAGRWFNEGDVGSADHVALVNEAYLSRIDNHGLGGTVRLTSTPGQDPRIVGVVSDTRRAGASEPAQPTVFIPLDQANLSSFAFVRQLVPFYAILRGRDMTPATGYAFARALQEIAPSLALGQPQSLDRVAHSASSAQRRNAMLLATFAALAMTLASVGHYSVQAVDVASRRRAFALRGALGATPMKLSGQVIRRALGTTLPGIAVGLLATFGLHLWVSPGDNDLGAIDLWVVVTVVLAMILATLAAVAIPALRAGAVEPWHVLRSD